MYSENNKFLAVEKDLKEVLEEIEKEKDNISNTLISETKKNKILESEIEQLKHKIFGLEHDVISDVGNELILKTEIKVLKEDYEVIFYYFLLIF